MGALSFGTEAALRFCAMDALSRRAHLPDVCWQHAIAYGALDDVRHAAFACKDLNTK